MRIRRVAPADLEALLQLCREHAAFEGATYVERGQQQALPAALFGPAPALHGWVVEGDGELAGYMTATLDYATWDACRFVHMDCLYLRPAYRRAGLGRRFIEELRRFATAHDCAEIQWQTPADNADAIAFYRRIGARGKAKQRFYLEVGAPTA